MVNLTDVYTAERTIRVVAAGLFESWFSLMWGTLYLTVACGNITEKLDWDYGLEPDEVLAIEGIIADHLINQK